MKKEFEKAFMEYSRNKHNQGIIICCDYEGLNQCEHSCKLKGQCINYI
jgi:hypothetical protein